MGPAENRKTGENPVRYRHCMRGGTTQGESQSLGVFPEKAVWELWMRKSGDLLLVAFSSLPVVGSGGHFVCRNTAVTVKKLSQLFILRSSESAVSP